MKKGDLEAKNRLIECNLRLVVYTAQKFENSNVNIEDLISIGTIGLIKAVSSFDNSKNSFGQNVGENKEIPFNSFLWIINDYLNNGLYQEIDKKYDKKNHGKINWKKTLNSEHYFSDNNVIFINPYFHFRNSNSQSKPFNVISI